MWMNQVYLPGNVIESTTTAVGVKLPKVSSLLIGHGVILKLGELP